MFFTFYELSTDASIWELFIYFVIHGMLQIIGAFVLLLLLVFAVAKQVFASFHGRQTLGYSMHVQRFSGATTLVAFSLAGVMVGGVYWSLLPSENWWIGWTTPLLLIVVCLFFTFIGVTTMVKTWKQVRHYG